MPTTDRRTMLCTSLAFAAIPSTAILKFGCERAQEGASPGKGASSAQDARAESNKAKAANDEKAMHIQYLEIVTPDVDAICKTYSKIHGVEFKDADPNLGGARTAKLANGGWLGIRAPLRDTEEPVVRPYILVDDIKAAVKAAADSGAEIALPSMELAGHGTCAIVVQGGIDIGFWQL